MISLLISLIWQKYHVRDLLGAIFNPYQILLYLYCPVLFTYGGKKGVENSSLKY